MMPRALVGLLVVLPLLSSAATASASDITQCGQVVSTGDIGVLQVDLVCPSSPGVRVMNAGTLELNGHSISAPGNSGIVAEPSGALRHVFTVNGPGTIADADVGIDGIGGIRVSDVTIHDAGKGIRTTKDSKRGKLRLIGVSITHSSDATNGVGVIANKVVANFLTVTGMSLDGIDVHRISGENVVASGNGPGVPSLGAGLGISADRIRLANLTASDNDGSGVLAGPVILRDSTLTGNRGAITNPNTGKFTSDIDLFTDHRPKVVNTVCGKSYNPSNDSDTSWHVCTNDGASPSGAFLEGGEE